jgi:iron complex transport system ATP-binding protein
MNACFELRNVTVRRGSINALDRVCLAFSPGEFVALVGLNGAGKSTLLETLSGILRGYSGSCIFEGSEISALKPRDLARHISFLPQGLPASLPFTVEQVVAMGRHPHLDRWFESPEDIRITEDAMRRTGCIEFRRRSLQTLSGGERQRALLAAVLAQQPQALLLDEPGTFVDLPHHIQMFRMLGELCLEGALCVAATHDINLAVSSCHRLILLDRGRVILDAPPAAALEDPRFFEIYGPGISAARTPSGRPWLWYGA